MGSSKGQSTSRTTQSTRPDRYAYDLYKNILGRAEEAGETPYEAYTGQQVAGLTPDQLAAFESVRGGGSQAMQEALGAARRGAAQISPEDIARYQDPYQQMVLDATLGRMRQEGEEDISALKGRSIAAGAFGGDRARLAEASLMSDQAEQRNRTIANLMSQGYSSSLAAAQADRQAAAQGAGALYSTPMGYYDALLRSGGAQQAQEQAELNVPYQQFLEERAFPYQQLQWLASLGTGVGSQMGGTQSGTQVATPAQPSPWSQALGLGLGLAAMPFGGPAAAGAASSVGSMLGSAIGGRAEGGRVKKADGGSATSPYGGAILPYSGVGIPIMPIQAQSNMPTGPLEYMEPKQDDSTQQLVKKAVDLAKTIKIGMNEPTTEGWEANVTPATGPSEYMKPETPHELYAPPTTGFAPMTVAESPFDYFMPKADGGEVSKSSSLLEGLTGLELSDAARQGLMAAGFGMLSSKSPFPGVAIGEGGQKGLETYQAYQDAQEKARIEKIKAEREAQKAQKEEAEEWGKAGAVFKDANGNFYTIQYSDLGNRKIVPVTVGEASAISAETGAPIQSSEATPTVSLTPSSGIEKVDLEDRVELRDKATGSVITTAQKGLTNAEYQRMAGKAQLEREQSFRPSVMAMTSRVKDIKDTSEIIKNLIPQVGSLETGFFGVPLSYIPGTDSTDVKNTIDTLQARFSFAELQKMRDESKTGGALGAVTERELDLLGKRVASLSQTQSPEKLKQNLEKVYESLVNLSISMPEDFEFANKDILEKPEFRDTYEKYYSSRVTNKPEKPGSNSKPKSPPPGTAGTRKDTQGRTWYVDENGKVLGRAD